VANDKNKLKAIPLSTNEANNVGIAFFFFGAWIENDFAKIICSAPAGKDLNVRRCLMG
jgi:hypothetical protein